ncbi:RDD family protein [Paraflavitalea sp. CAU 1676]|uniref:RDD family protein n=1 Tax=Paraflavitalea sp. CAU 1676 TaxID=3032598 RepID=UPI0023D99A2D|nr:RDD family protein [Paraflavitalea sp. CAU 1676]MDF2187585.1 RDD family protein [Paraflavitalea sp. CAU 1676]
MEPSSPNLLEEFEKTAHLVPVSPILRFLNGFVDIAVVYGVSATLLILIGPSLYTTDEFGNTILPPEPLWPLLLFAAYLMLLITYYTIFEYANKGRTLGKMATGTLAIREDGNHLTVKDALLRSLCRLIPFEFISAFGRRAWHDSLTRTLVVKKY